MTEVLVEGAAGEEVVSLYFQVRPGEYADLEVVSAAAIQWAQAVRAAAQAIEPGALVRIEMLGATTGSLRWLTAIERQLEQIHRGWGRFPRLTQLGIALSIFVPTVGIPTYDFYFGDHGLPKADRERIDHLIALGSKAPGVETPKRHMFNALGRDPKITGVGVAPNPTADPTLIIPSNQFAEHGGLFQLQELPDEERTVWPTLDVELLSAHLANAPRAWTFQQEGLAPFTAIMKDKHFLNALEHSEVRERLRSHIPMRIRLEVKQIFRDGEWRVKPRGRSVVEVISPKVGG